MQKAIVALAVALTAAGCGSADGTSNGGAGGGGGGAVELSALCGGFASAASTQYESCLKATPGFVASLQRTFPARSGCQDAQKAVAGGRAAFDPAKAAGCLSAVQGDACTTLDVGFDNPACRDALTGKVAPGDACYADFDCAGGTCDTSTSCPGRCLAYLTSGQECRLGTAECAPGLTCDGTCKVESDANGPCPCKPGLYCDEGAGACAAKRTVGACAGPDRCATGYACVGSSCQALVAVGGGCTPPASVSDATVCGLGAFCDPATSRCAAWPDIGQSCAASIVCGNGYCDDATRLCSAPMQDGARCANVLECRAGSYCDVVGDHTCKPATATGEACASSIECQSLSCVAGRCAARAGVCAEP